MDGGRTSKIGLTRLFDRTDGGTRERRLRRLRLLDIAQASDDSGEIDIIFMRAMLVAGQRLCPAGNTREFETLEFHSHGGGDAFTEDDRLALAH